MSTEQNDEVELRDLVMQVLESNGTLNNLRSQLRASVFLALDSSTNLKSSMGVKDDSKMVALLKSSEGLNVLGLCRDLLSSCDLSYTLNVFDSEIKQSLGGGSLPSRPELLSRLGLSHDFENIPTSSPLLCTIVSSQRTQALAEQFAVEPDQIVAARKIFSRFESLGCISYEQLLTALDSAFPSIEKRLMQNYCMDHYQDVSTGEANIDFEEFLSLYCYFLSIKNFSIKADQEGEEETVSEKKRKKGTKSPKGEKKRSVSPIKSNSVQEDKWNEGKDDDPLGLLPKIATNKKSRRSRENLFAIDKALDSLNLEDDEKTDEPSSISTKDDKPSSFLDIEETEDMPDETASFFNEQPPWETDKDYTDDFAPDEGATKSLVETDCKVTDVSEGEDDFTVYEGAANSRPTSGRDRTTPDKVPNLADHPRLADVQFLEDVESTKF